MLYADGQTYEWDENKRALNLARHGLDFRDVARVDWDTVNTYETDRRGEPRWIAFMYIGAEFFAVVYTVREGRIRLISFRHARQEEEHKYATTKSKGHHTNRRRGR